MSFTFTVPGQPPSVNHSYKDVVIRKKNGGTYRTRAKTPEAEAYQVVATLACRAAKPSRWEAGERVRVTLAYHLRRDADGDNLQKLLLDAVALGLGVNDRIFLPCVASKDTGNKEPYTEVTVE